MTRATWTWGEGDVLHLAVLPPAGPPIFEQVPDLEREGGREGQDSPHRGGRGGGVGGGLCQAPPP